MSCESIADLTMEMFEEDCREQILSHIKELHEAVVDMKSAFTVAQEQLQNVQGDDENLKAEINSTKSQCEKQSADILKLLLSLKGEVGSVKEALQSTQLIQHGLQSSVQTLVVERDLLLDELAKTGAISENIRGRLHSRLNGFGRPSSGSQSTNDSGVALLLEKAHAAFQPIQNNMLVHHHHRNGANGSPNENDSTGNNNSVSSGFGGLIFGSGGSGDSLSDPHLVSPHVQEYLNNLSPHPPSHQHPHQLHHMQFHHHHHNNNDRLQLINNGGDPAGYSSYSTTEEATNGVVYDSDCSLTLAATKSLSLSNSLSKQCGMELAENSEDQKNRSRHEHEIHTGISVEKDTANQRGNGQPSYLTDGEFATEEKTGVSFKEGQRLSVAKELLETERKYCHTLKTIQQTFANPLKNSGVLSTKDINTLFPEEVFDLYEKHCCLLTQLEERIASWKSQPTIGDLLERFTNGRGSDVLRLYTSYVNDFPEVLKTFHKLCRSSREFTQFLKSSLEHPTCGGLDLGAFLLSPVQRMPRYILLLKQMIKYTDPSHLDYKDITTCLDRLRDYLKRLNDSMEHSFQLVTAQITPQPDDDKGLFGSKNSFPRASVSSSHSSTGGEEVVHKVRYKRSTSVPRNQNDTTLCSVGKEGKGKLKSRSKSDWTVCTKNNTNNESGIKGRRCQTCNCGQTPGDHESRVEHSSNKYSSHQPKKIFERTLSDSDINSDGEDASLLDLDGDNKGDGRKFSTSKSLHDFNNDEGRSDWFISEPSLCEGNNTVKSQSNYETILRNNVMVRPLTTAQPGRYVAKIQRGNCNSEMNLHMIGADQDRPHKNKKMSLRTSLKNIFSLKKRTTRTLQISGPILPSRPNVPTYGHGTPPPVAVLSYNNSRDGGVGGGPQSLPPDNLPLKYGQETDEEIAASLPPVQTTSRYIKHSTSKLSNPKLPKTPFMTKYCAHNTQRPDEQRNSPFTDI